VTILIWCFVERNDGDPSVREQFSASEFGQTGVDIVVLSLLRSSILYYTFAYSRSKTFKSLFISTITFSLSTGYLLIKLLYSYIAKEHTTVPIVIWGLIISVIQIILYLTFRQRRIRGKYRPSFNKDGLPAHEKLSNESDADLELGERKTSESKQPDHMAFVETSMTLKSAATFTPEQLKDDDSLFMKTMGITLHYKMWKSEDFKGRDATVLLHGFGGSVFDWREIWEPMKETTKCIIAIDMPGSGITSRPQLVKSQDNPYSQKYACRLLFSVLDALDVKSCRLIGHGMGGCLAVHAAITHSHIVSSVTMISPMVFMDPFPKFIRDLFRTSIGKELVIALVRSQIGELVLRKAWYDKKKIPKIALKRYETLVKVKNWHVALVELSRAQPLKITPKHLAQLSCPVQIIHGVKDKIVPISNSARIANELSCHGISCKIWKIPACGHVPHEEAPAEFVAALTGILTEGTEGKSLLDAAKRKGMGVEEEYEEEI